MINIRNHSDIHLFLDKVKAFLAQKASENNLSLGILHERTNTQAQPHEYFIEATDQNEVVFTLVKTQKNFIIAGDEKYINDISLYLIREKVVVENIIGEKSLASAFASHYCQLVDKTWQLEMDQLVYKITNVKKIETVRGKLAIATKKDTPLIAKWIHHFCKEVFDFMTEEQALEYAHKGIEEKSFYLWKTTENVAMVKSARPAVGGIVLNYVFTPTQHRGKGYASSMVYTLTSKLLESYDFCSLFTDAKNPVSNTIYIKIGYEKIAEAAVIHIS
jgi:predicted GNAT family acetyltransferase